MTIEELLKLSITKRGKAIYLVRKELMKLPQSKERDIHYAKVATCRPCLPKAILWLKAQGVTEVIEHENN